ncbi:MAG: hypothetical protein IMW89_00215 [Ktedonobacteraceae bacterium]|nr:hypothetical protein [Ktedonobacteraceae bacterium]
MNTTNTTNIVPATPAQMSEQKPRREALNESRVWLVFARRKYEEPLHEVGNVMADDVELARVYARSIYDEFPWIEMVLVPRESIVKVIDA